MKRRDFLKLFAGVIATASLDAVAKRYDKEQMRLAKSKLPRLIYVIDTNSGITRPAYGSEKTEIMLEKMGFLVGDGRPLCKVKYANLYAAIGTAYGGTQTEFNIPDFRAQFVVTK